MAKFLEKLFGDQNKKTLKTFQPTVDKINALEKEFEALTDKQIQDKTQEFKDRLAKGETLDDILVEAFATVREAGKRVLSMRHYDVQLIGGITLHKGKIAEMRTGEGKTLVGTLPTYLNALEEKGVHVITVNDYLAKRDATWMGKLYDFLGLSVGIVQNQRVSFKFDASGSAEVNVEDDNYHVDDTFLQPITRQEAYACDITYGTNNEFGFDYLRDNMVQNISELVMRKDTPMHYTVIDEIDSILIDEARTPLIISAPAEEAADMYYQFASHVKMLKEDEDYNIDEKMKSATLSDSGVEKIEKKLGVDNLYVEGGMQLVHHIEQALKAEVLFKNDKDYVVEGDEVVIIDEFTGRKMPGRRYSEGLHQAIEAKEGVVIQRESKTLATVTFQNLFRMYTKLSGMTGTAETEKEEFYKIYGLDVLVIPTNEEDKRIDHNDHIYINTVGKYKAVVKRINQCREKGQPILIGTISVEKNEELSNYLTANGIQHEILNAKNHEREGEIVANAGKIGAVTLATNMAGRGVDIKLGGADQDPEENKKVLAAGGLFVLGTERHDSRRIDNQLRGRSARQGDPGETQFFVTTEDDLMRVFAGDRLKTVMEKMNVPEDMPIEQKMITKMLENAQGKVESHNYDIRKHLLQYDDVLNRHREVVYEKRRKVLELSTEDVHDKKLEEHVLEIIENEVEVVVSFHTNSESIDPETGEQKKDTWNTKEIAQTVQTIFPLEQKDVTAIEAMKPNGDEKLDEVEIRTKLIEFIMEKAKVQYALMKKGIEAQLPEGQDIDTVFASVLRTVTLRSTDGLWVDHLVSSSHLRTGIGLRGYGQRDPLVEYKKEMYHMFNMLLSSTQKEIVYSLFKISVGIQLAPSIMDTENQRLEGAQKTAEDAIKMEKKTKQPKVGRNEACPCGSGKKYKKCHGKG